MTRAVVKSFTTKMEKEEKRSTEGENNNNNNNNNNNKNNNSKGDLDEIRTREKTHNENYGKVSHRKNGSTENSDVDATKIKGGNKRHKDQSKVDHQQMMVPVVTVEHPTPSPHPPPSRGAESGVGVDRDEEDEDLEEDEDMDYDTGEEEEIEEEEEVETEMTPEEKLAMYTCVKEGDIDALEDCLDMPNADINMTWFQENLLMAAIREGQTEMAEFLVDNGIDHTFTTSRLVLRETPDGKRKFDRYEIDCRQVAFDQELDDLVFLLDHLQGRLFPFVPAPKRSPRLRRPPTVNTPFTDSNADDGNSSDADVSHCSSHDTQDVDGNERHFGANEYNDVESRKRKVKKKREKKKSGSGSPNGENNELEDDERDGIYKYKPARIDSAHTEVDSGNFSIVSSNTNNKLRKSVVEVHNKLIEEHEKGHGVVENQSNINSPRKSVVSRAESEKSHNKCQQGGSEKSHSKSQQGESEKDKDKESKSEYSRSKTTSAATTKIMSPRAIWNFHPPNDPLRMNRSYVSNQRSKELRRFYTSPLNESNIATPLQWKKVSTAGSYTKESKNWHYQDSNGISSSIRPVTSISTADIRQNSNMKTFDLRPTTSIPSVKSNSSPLPSVTSSSSSSTTAPPPSSISSNSHLTNPSLLSPTSSKSSPRSSTSSLSSNRAKITSSPSILKNSSSSQNNKSVIQSQSFKTQVMLKKEKPPVAGYLRHTKSTITKQRLTPQFVDSYGGLDFHHSPTTTTQLVNPKMSLTTQPGKLQDNVKSTSQSKISPVLSSISHKPPTNKSNLQLRNFNTISFRV